jgi:hypothetical protein
MIILPKEYFVELYFCRDNFHTWSLIINDKLIIKGVGYCPDYYRLDRVDYIKGERIVSLRNECNDYFIYYHVER